MSELTRIVKDPAKHSHSIFQAPSAMLRTSERRRSKKRCGRSAELQNLILRFRRARRVCRPYFVVVIRLLIVLFTAIELQPISEHAEDDLWPIFSRLNILVGTMASMFSVIYFDSKVFSYGVLGALFVKFMFDLCLNEGANAHQHMAWLNFHATAVLFSMLIGRRRSIIKPLVFKENAIATEPYYIANMKHLRHIDVLEAGLRFQASLLAVDYSLSFKASGTLCFFTIPFAILYTVGYSTGRNGAVVLGLLFSYSVTSAASPILGFTFIKTIGTLAGALLGLAVGPGMLTVDEWLENARQLCY